MIQVKSFSSSPAPELLSAMQGRAAPYLKLDVTSAGGIQVARRALEKTSVSGRLLVNCFNRRLPNTVSSVRR